MKLKDTNISTQLSTIKQRGYVVVKANNIIQKSHFSLTAQQQKALLTMISKIKPDDKPEQHYTFSIKEFCLMCNIECDSGKNYDNVKRSLYSIDKQVMWIKEPDKKKQTRLRWLDKLYINEGSGNIEFTFHSDMFPYLLNLREQYTQYNLVSILPMRSKYAIRLYELLKSYEGAHVIPLTDVNMVSFTIEDVKKRLDAERYENKEIRRRVLEASVKEINNYTDLQVSYEMKKVNSRSFNVVSFTFERIGAPKAHKKLCD